MLKKILLGLLGLIFVVGVGGYIYYRLVIYQPPAISEQDRASIFLMPLPATLKLKNAKFEITPNLSIEYPGYSDQKIEKSVGRFLKRLSDRSKVSFLNKGSNEASLIINCINEPSNNIQQVKEDESYTLIISSGKIELESFSSYGTLRGLETLLQLLKVEEEKPYFPAVEIEDAPRFSWRGLMIDVSRHWIPKKVILRNLDAMASVKMNVLHLHLSDDQGFRVESKVFPRLHEVGSNGKFYTQEDIHEIISYAADRGIRIIPEFDVPGHTKSWQIAYPEIGSATYPLQFGSMGGEFFPPPLDPTREEVYEFLDRLFGEMADLFPDPYVHIGGDEVNPTHWLESESISLFMKDNDIMDGHELQAYFNKRISQIIKKHGKIMLGWEEILHDDLSEDIVIQAWKSQKTLFEGVKQGSSGILSTGWYLDHKLPAEKHYLVDPLILPGAVDIVPDYENWKMYDIQIELPGNAMDGQIILFDKDPQNAYGFFAFLDDRNAFKNALITDGKISFDFATPVGELAFSAMIDGDSLSGNLALGFLKFASNGVRTGGSDMKGTEMPKIEIIKPLTESEKNKILGGEAAMWSEVVSEETIDSRLWPRTAAIAEKLWSPSELTTDIEDMYRRLEITSNLIAEEGSIHKSQYPIMLERLVGGNDYSTLKSLVDVMEEVKYYNRLSTFIGIDSLYLPDLPLDHVADVARPESFEARKFNKLVDRYIENLDEADRMSIAENLDKWAQIHTELSEFISGNPKLEEIDSLSMTFSNVCRILVGLNSGGKLTEVEMADVMNEIDYLDTGDNGVLVAVAPGLRKLVMNSLSK